jgi:hypothetical protein
MPKCSTEFGPEKGDSSVITFVRCFRSRLRQLQLDPTRDRGLALPDNRRPVRSRQRTHGNGDRPQTCQAFAAVGSDAAFEMLLKEFFRLDSLEGLVGG